MTDAEFDAALIAACFADVAEAGWPNLSIARAARAAGLDLARARTRLPSPAALLLAFGAMADRVALTEMDFASGSPNERLFDLLMRRIDVLQTHRAGVLALLRALPTDPANALLLLNATAGSMRWMLDAAGLPAGGPGGALRANGLVAVWAWTIRTWQSDTTADLSTTMATLDAALARAAQIARSMGATDRAEAPPPEAAAVALPPTPESSFAA